METRKYRFKGHESFVPREGWITKALIEVDSLNGESTFKENYGADRLGVGPNMAKAIRYWIESAGLVKMASGKASLTKLGKIILKNDAYLEDIFTLWIIHLNLVMNKEKVTAWFLFFSKFEMESFTSEELKNVMSYLVQANYGSESKVPSNNSVIADCEAILQMYAKERNIDVNPEEKKKSPFLPLKLIRSEGGKYRKIQPQKNQLDKLVVWYGIVKSINDVNSVSLDDLVSKAGMIGKSLNMKRVMLSEYIDLIAESGKITVNKTAGLDMVYVEKKQSLEQILEEYYENRR